MLNTIIYLKKITRILGLVFIVSLTSCGDDEDPNLKKYLHLSHTRTDANPAMNGAVESQDLTPYDMLWLGGDMALNTSDNTMSMDYVDGFFDFANPNTLWAVGNHDYTNPDLISTYTNRQPYYTSHKNGITFLVLDTQDNSSSITGAQLDLVNQVCDTLSGSSHLVVLTHKLIWMYGDDQMEDQISTVSNGSLGSCFFCLNPNNFYDDVYPRLLEIKNNGIEVICVGGDIGVQLDEFEYVNLDGISFIASGIKKDDNNPKFLLFNHDLLSNTLQWEYIRSQEL